MKLFRWLFGAREPDYEKLLERTASHANFLDLSADFFHYHELARGDNIPSPDQFFV